MEPLGIETVALLAEANIESLRRLTDLPSGAPVGVVGWGQTCMENLSRSIEGAGLDHLRFVQVYVVRLPVDEEEAKRHEVLERVMDLAAARGVPVEELGYALLARGGVRPQERTPILFVECTRAELDQFSDELEEQLPVEVERVLLEDLAHKIAESEELPWRMAVTTFFHVHEVQEIVEPRGMETVALLAEANIESLRRLTELPEGTPVGVVGWGQTCMENLSRSIEGAGLDHLRFVQVYVDEQTDEVLETLEGVEAVVCASITARKLREVGIPEEMDIIEEDRVLDQGGIEMLGRMLRERQPNAAS